MIAIYQCDDSSPFTILYVTVTRSCLNDKDTFIMELIDNDYPYPSSEVLFMENDQECGRYWLNKEYKGKYFYFRAHFNDNLDEI